MLGYIYVFTNKVFPNDILNIQVSFFDKEQFSDELNKHYLDPIKIVIQQPTVNILDAKDYLQDILKKYRYKKENFYKITTREINIILLNMTIRHSKKYIF